MSVQSGGIVELLLHTIQQLQVGVGMAGVFPTVFPMISTNLSTLDNEELTQILLLCVHTLQSKIPIVSLWPILQRVFGALSYNLIVEEVPRDALQAIIYYARVTEEGVLRCPVHPFRLMEFLPHKNFPASYKLLFYNQGYLRNVVSVHDAGAEHNTVTLLRLQPVVLHFT